MSEDTLQINEPDAQIQLTGKSQDQSTAGPSGGAEWLHHTDYKLLFENNHLGIATTDPQFRFVRVNRAFERMTGYQAEALLNGMNLGQLSPNPGAAKKSKALIDSLYSREIESFELEKTYRCADGSLMEALTSVTATYLEDGTLAGCTAFILDVSERRKMERDLNQALLHMETAQKELVRAEKLASLGALVAGIAHEINTPIGSCLTIASSLQERINKLTDRLNHPEQDFRDLDQAMDKLSTGAGLLVTNLKRAAELITHFKQVAVDRSTGVKRAFFLHALVNEVLATVKHICGQRIKFHVEIPQTIHLESFPGELGRVFNNLIENALVHGFPNDRQGQLWISAKPLKDPEGDIEILVRDDGVGMAPEITDKVFDPFFTTTLGTGGSGMGMHIVYGIVTNLLQGRCNFKSTVGKGSQFRMVIPSVVKEITKE